MGEERTTITAAEAAKVLGVHPMTITRMIRAGELDAYKLRPSLSNSPYRVFLDSVDAILEQRRMQAASNSSSSRTL